MPTRRLKETHAEVPVADKRDCNQSILTILHATYVQSRGDMRHQEREGTEDPPTKAANFVIEPRRSGSPNIVRRRLYEPRSYEEEYKEELVGCGGEWIFAGNQPPLNDYWRRKSLFCRELPVASLPDM
jgi:hypothetical protein